MLVRIFSNLVYLLKELGKVIPVTDEADDETVSDDIESLQKKLADAQEGSSKRNGGVSQLGVALLRRSVDGGGCES